MTLGPAHRVRVDVVNNFPRASRGHFCRFLDIGFNPETSDVCPIRHVALQRQAEILIGKVSSMSQIKGLANVKRAYSGTGLGKSTAVLLWDAVPACTSLHSPQSPSILHLDLQV